MRRRAVGATNNKGQRIQGEVAGSAHRSGRGGVGEKQNAQGIKTGYPYEMFRLTKSTSTARLFRGFANPQNASSRSCVHLHHRDGQIVAGRTPPSRAAEHFGTGTNTPARVRLPPRERVGRHSGRHGRRLPAPGVPAEPAARESGAPRFATPVRARVSTCCRPILARGLPAVLRRRRLFTPNLPSRRHRARPDRPF